MKKFKLLLVLSLLVTLFPAQIHASEETIYDQIQTIVENKVKEIAKSINRKDADLDAGIALAKKGLKGGSKLVVGKTHPLMATLMNSNLILDILPKGLTDGLNLMQSLNKNYVHVNYGYDYGNGAKYYRIYDKLNLSPVGIEDETLLKSYHYNHKNYNEYDNSLIWMVGAGNLEIQLTKKKVTNDKITYNVEVMFMDRFDFKKGNDSLPKEIMSIIGIFTLKPFEWEAKFNFTIDIPNQCNHKTNDYTIEFDKTKYQMDSANVLISKLERNSKDTYYYRLDKPIVLEYDKPWILEYTMNSVDKSFMFGQTPYESKIIDTFTHQKNKYLFFELRTLINTTWTYDEYGFVLNDLFSCIPNQMYTFKLENSIQNNKNMIMLSVYSYISNQWVINKEPMDDQYQINNGYLFLKQENSAYLVGKDYRINYFGGSHQYPFVTNQFSMKVYENGMNGQTDTFIDKITKPTCTEKGYTTRTCSRCGYSYKIKSTNALGHTFNHYVSNGDGTSTSKCDTCDVTDTKIDIIYGDVNSDHEVNSKDRMQLARNLARWNGYDDINLMNADVNSDGKVNSEDRMILARHLARWQGYETLPYIK